MKCKCKNCEIRTFNCHDFCEDYLEYIKSKEKRKKEKEKMNIISGYVYDTKGKIRKYYVEE